MQQAIQTTAQLELSRFLGLAARTEDLTKMKMPRCAVDEAWHDYLERPSEYIRFSAESAGTYFAHVKGSGYEEMKWVPEYERSYGKLPKIWFTDANGGFSEKAYDEYTRTGTLIASWDCGPVLPDTGRRIQKDIENLKKIIDINKKVDILNEIPIPGADKMEKIDDAALIDAIKEKMDRFNIEEIKKKYPLKP